MGTRNRLRNRFSIPLHGPCRRQRLKSRSGGEGYGPAGDPNGDVDARPWCQGLHGAMRLRLSAWAPLLDISMHHGMLLPILLHCVDDQGRPRPVTSDGMRSCHISRCEGIAATGLILLHICRVESMECPCRVRRRQRGARGRRANRRHSGPGRRGLSISRLRDSKVRVLSPTTIKRGASSVRRLATSSVLKETAHRLGDDQTDRVDHRGISSAQLPVPRDRCRQATESG
jgi:hypothetical protein